MTRHVIIWDLETVPDYDALRRVHGIDASDEELDADVLKGKFPKHIFHKIVCIGAIVAQNSESGWTVIKRGAPHCGERDEATLIRTFVERIGALHPTLVSFNGHGFDLPVLRYRAMIHKIRAPGLMAAPYFHRYGASSVDLMDELASYGTAKATLHEICRSMELPGKASGVEGSQVKSLHDAGKLNEIAEYCLEDVTNTYRLWLRYELFCGRLTDEQFKVADAQAEAFTGKIEKQLADAGS